MQIATLSGSTGPHFLSQAPHASAAQNADNSCLKSGAVLEGAIRGGRWFLPEVSLGPPGPSLRIMLRWVFFSPDSVGRYSSERVSALGLPSLDAVQGQSRAPV